MDNRLDISAELLASTPVEKCSLNNRRGKNSAQKRRLLTGFIIYASEARKRVVDSNPNQNFGDISRLVGNEWRELPLDIRTKYDQRALIHNKRVKEKAQKELNSSGVIESPKFKKFSEKKLKKLARESSKHEHKTSHSNGFTPPSNDSPKTQVEPQVSTQASSSVPKISQQLKPEAPAPVTKPSGVNFATQTNPIRFVAPPAKKPLKYSESFKKYALTLAQTATNNHLEPPIELEEPKVVETSQEEASSWLNAGKGRHESVESALWALRDFLLQDAMKMRKNLDPYLKSLQES